MKTTERGYKKTYEVYGHYRDNKEKLYSEYVHDYCLVYAREQFQKKYPDIVIDTIRLSKWYK